MNPADTGQTESLWEEFDDIDVADIVVDVDAPDLLDTYAYRVPEHLRNALKVGACVHIPFSGRETIGYVLSRRRLAKSAPLANKLKDIIALIEDAVAINFEQIQIAQWMSERYVCSLLDAVRCVAPPYLNCRVETMVRLAYPNMNSAELQGSVNQAHLVETLMTLGKEAELEKLKQTANIASFRSAYTTLLARGIFKETRRIARPTTVGKKTRAYRLGAVADVLSTSGRVVRRTVHQERVLETLAQWCRTDTRPMPGSLLLERAEASSSVLKGLVDKGLVVGEDIAVRRMPTLAPAIPTNPPTLSPPQAAAVTKLREAIASGEFGTILLFGITASGKTEVYLNAIDETLRRGRNAIVLVPEIALTMQVVDVFIGRFGDQVAVLHSKLSDGERHDEWRRIQQGIARIVVGARSAIFAPITNVGLIVVDEEHEASYKQENTPRYNAKDLAMERARIAKATLLLGSATPSLESYFATEQPDSAYTRIEMLQRVANRPLPTVEIVDLREEFKKRRALFSEQLEEAIRKRLHQKQQTILFLNRRGYAQFVLCRDCGWVAKCPQCAVSLAFHAYERSLKCHHCEYREVAPTICPDCKGQRVKAFGIGTEKVEEEALRIFPTARIGRLDRDTTAQKGAHSRIVREFREGEADILIGTQMVAKGLDFPNVTLVGVISADTALNMPDFRAAERTFQLLTQVAGRAGRGQIPGNVIIQTFTPDHYAIQTAVVQDYVAFYKNEIEFRLELKYPPYSRFVNLICTATQENKARDLAVKVSKVLNLVKPDHVETIGPAPAPLSRLKNQFRFHIALRAPIETPLSRIVRESLNQLSPIERQGIMVDVDPLSMA